MTNDEAFTVLRKGQVIRHPNWGDCRIKLLADNDYVVFAPATDYRHVVHLAYVFIAMYGVEDGYEIDDKLVEADNG